MTRTAKPSTSYAQAAGATGRAVTATRDADFEFDEADDSWLDEELTDEELAALGEEDFEDEAFLEAELQRLEAAGGRGVRPIDDVAEAELEDFAEDDLLGDEPVDAANAAADQHSDNVVALSAAHASADSYDLNYEDGDLYTDEQVADEMDLNDLDADNLDDDGVDSAPVRRGDGRSSTVVSLAAENDSEQFADDDEPGEMRQYLVPRIAIHAFCETPDLTTILEKAAVDRRLSKAHLTIHMGGIAKAVAHFQSASTPNLIIVEAGEGGKALFGQLSELAEVCDPTTKVIIIGRINDIALYRQLVSQGVSDYIVRPRSPLQVIQAISSLYVDPSAPPIGRTIAFFGARGGVGSSTIAHNVAWSAAEQHESDTVILDFDLAFGTASLDFEQDPTSGLLEALSSPDRLDDVLLDRLLQKHTERLSLFTAPNLLDRDYDLDQQAFETVIDVVRSAAPTIIVDIPHIWTGWSKRILQTADEVVITATPDLASFRNTKNLVDIIAGARPNDPSPILVLNQFDSKTSSVQAEQFVEHVGIQPALTIGWEPQLFQAAATNAATIIDVAPKTRTAQGLKSLCSRVLGREPVSARKQKFSLAGLFGR